MRLMDPITMHSIPRPQPVLEQETSLVHTTMHETMWLPEVLPMPTDDTLP